MLIDFDLSVPPYLKVSSLRVGIDNSERLSRWLANGYQATMSYLSSASRVQRNADNSLLDKNSRSIIMFLLNYRKINVAKEGYGKIASYASFPDYHKFFPRLIKKFMIENHLFLDKYSTYVDTGPILERSLAAKSKLGWIGKNSMLINPSFGSFTFIGSAVTDLPIDSQTLPSPDLCGKCTRCIDSCPTKAINLDRTINSNLCISYHTIESREIIPLDIAKKMGDMIFGCDICNDVCPWNRGKGETTLEEIHHNYFGSRMKLEDIAFIDKPTFDDVYRGSAIKRATFEGFARNALIALNNIGNEEIVREASKQFSDLRGKQAALLLGEHP